MTFKILGGGWGQIIGGVINPPTPPPPPPRLRHPWAKQTWNIMPHACFDFPIDRGLRTVYLNRLPDCVMTLERKTTRHGFMSNGYSIGGGWNFPFCPCPFLLFAKFRTRFWDKTDKADKTDKTKRTKRTKLTKRTNKMGK